MPFNQPLPRAFTEVSIRRHAPATAGIYGLSNGKEWIYIGDCENIQQALLRHFSELNTALLNRQPTGFVFEICDWVRRPARHNQLVLEYEPACNRHWSRRI